MDNNSIPILDNQTELARLDQDNLRGSIQALGDQIADAWDQVQTLNLSLDTGRVRNIVVSGMGGSALGPDIIKRAFKNELTIPFEIVNDYALPGYVGADSLVIVSSYSGTTEETLASAQDAKQRGAQILGITVGGELLDFLHEHGQGYYQIDPRHNPSRQPRMAVGYSVFGIVALLTKAGLLPLSDDQVNGVIGAVRRQIKELDISVPQDQNQAKQTAFQLIQRVPVFLAAEHLEGAVHVMQNQFNENTKCYAEYRILPEFDHHLLEALQFPEHLDQVLSFLLFNSNLYHPHTQKRFPLTQQVLEEAGLETTLIQLEGSNRLEQAFEVLVFSAFTSFYLAMLEGINPAAIPTVTAFKEKLRKE